MPELPEVETVRLSLEERIRGRRVLGYRVARPTFYRVPPRERLEAVVGRRVAGVGRRGKYLIIDCEGAPLVMHLGMSGRISLGEGGRHVRFELSLEGGPVLRFDDARRFGRVGCPLPPLGPEPLSADFTVESLRAALRARRAPVKAVLMDQAAVAGVGNIYATEALFRAGVRPSRRARSLSREESGRLHAAVREVLAQGVRLGGSTLEDESFLDPLGRPGRAQRSLAVYGRERGACGHPLKATPRPISGRTSLYCPECQR